MTELTSVLAVKTPVVATKSPPPIPGRPEYGHALVPAGSVVSVVIQANGKSVATLGPWTAVPKVGRNALVQVRLVVHDDCAASELEPKAEAETL